MKKFVTIAFAATAALTLAACGSSESAKEEAQADNVEMPAEEAVQDVDAAATPVADAAASAAPSEAASAAVSEAPSAAAKQ
jgi:PBP1b-binding outer membrane lipoprotein LpoB